MVLVAPTETRFIGGGGESAMTIHCGGGGIRRAAKSLKVIEKKLERVNVREGRDYSEISDGQKVNGNLFLPHDSTNKDGLCR